MPRRGRIDPLGRRAALALGGARVGLGIGALFVTGPTLKALLFGETDSVGRALAKLAGGRDLALGLMTLALRDDAQALRTVTLAAAALDAADAFSLGLVARDGDTRLAGLGGVVSGGGAALAGAWAWHRLGDS
jgi:type IV secretory pathway protease TraF